ncbi:permease [Rhodococcus aerolatus]
MLLTWAKWQPYALKVPRTASTHTLGTSFVTGSSATGNAVSLSTGLSFARSYFLAIWPALVAALLIAAAVQVLLPSAWLARTLGRGRGGALRGGALATPSMMCTCCAAPIAVGLRRRRASTGATLAFWLGNPALNPVVLVLCALVLPWQWALLRGLGGVAVVGGVVALSRARGQEVPAPDAAAPVEGPLGRAFLTRLGGLAVRLLPEYLVLVVALGAFSGVLVSGTVALGSGVLAALVLAVAGTLLPIPTSAEVPAVSALLLLGVGAPVAAALLVTLPALSLPSLVMVRRVFPARVLAATTAWVVVVGLLTSVAALGLGL